MQNIIFFRHSHNEYYKNFNGGLKLWQLETKKFQLTL